MAFSVRTKGGLISEGILTLVTLPKKYSVFLPLACWRLSFEFSRDLLIIFYDSNTIKNTQLGLLHVNMCSPLRL